MKFNYLFFLMVLILTSCGSPATPAPTQTITPAPTATQTLTPTVAPTNTPTITPTKAPEAINPSNAPFLDRYAVLGHGKTEKAAVSPDHKTIAVASTIGVILYDAETLEKIKIIETNQTTHSVTFSPDSTKIAIGLPNPVILEDQKTRITAVEVWDIQTSKRLFHIEDYSGSQFWDVRSLVFSPDGCQIIDWGKIIHNICDNTTSKKSDKDWRSPSAIFSPDGTKALVYAIQGGWSLWDIQQNKEVRDLLINASLNFKGTYILDGLPIYSPDGKTIASYQKDQIYLLDGIEFKQIAQYKINTVIKSLYYSPNSEFLAAFGEDSKLHLLSTATGEQLGESDVIPYVPLVVTFSPDSKHVTSLDDYINIYKWNVPEMELEKSHTDFPLESHGAFSNDGKYLAVISQGSSKISEKDFPPMVVIFDANTLEKIYLLEGGHDQENRIGGLAFSPDGKYLALSDSSAGIVNLWDVSTWKLSGTLEVVPGRRFKLMEITGNLWGVAFSPDGKIVAAVNPFGDRIYFWDVNSGELIDDYVLPNYKNFGKTFGPIDFPRELYFSDDGSQVIINKQFPVDWKKKESMGFLWGGVFNNTKTIFVYSSGCAANSDWESVVYNEFCISTSKDFDNSMEGKVFAGKVYAQSENFVFNPRGDILLQASNAGVVILWHIKEGWSSPE